MLQTKSKVKIVEHSSSVEECRGTSNFTFIFIFIFVVETSFIKV